MDKIPIIPADPMEAASIPIEGVDIPEENSKESAVQKKGDDIPANKPHQDRAFAENEGLVKPDKRPATGVETTNGAELEAAAEAAQRGRTA